MKVYYRGFNLYQQFSKEEKLVEKFIDCKIEGVTQIEVSYFYVVMLVADDTLLLKGARNFEYKMEEKVLKITSNEDRVLAILSNGDIVKIMDSVSKLPKLPELDSNHKIKLISSGSKLAIAVSENGQIYNIPNKLKYVNKFIIDIKTGREHCLLLDAKGSTYSFGRGRQVDKILKILRTDLFFFSRGQLGHGCLDDEEEPRFIEVLGGIFIKAISAGGWHSCALSKDGDMYVWGWNVNGQLGLLNVQVMASPQVLQLDFNIIQIGCGGRHTVALAGITN